MNRHRWLSPGFLIGVAAFIALGNLLYLAVDERHLWIHPSFHFDILRQSTVNGLGFDLRDFQSLFVQRMAAEARARFLNYLLMTWDQKIRLALYNYFPVHPALLPITSTLYLIVGPVLLHRTVKTWTSVGVAGSAAVAVLLSSVGFLSCFAMTFMAAKPLSLFGYICVLFLATRLDARASQGELVYETSGAPKYFLIAVLFIAFYLDELMFFAFVLPPLLFPQRFVARKGSQITWRRIGSNAVFYMLPVIVLVASLTTIVPYMTKTYYGWEFHYFSFNMNLSNQINYGGEYPPDFHPDARFITWAGAMNLRNLFEISLFSWPLTLAPLGRLPTKGLYSLGDVPTWLRLVGLGAFAVLQVVLMRGAHSQAGRLLRRLWLATLLFAGFLTLLQLKHVPVVIGYNYGAGFGVFLALLIAVSLARMWERGVAWRWAAGTLVLYVVVVQLSNFYPLNKNWDLRHRPWVGEQVDPSRYPFPHRPIRLDLEQPTSSEERRAIWETWKIGRLDQYVAQHRISASALSLVFELDEIDAKRGESQSKGSLR